MRLATSCPECSAAFYVLPDQLAAHRGEVRCGKCEHVFNALDRLAEVDGEEIAASAHKASEHSPENIPSSEPVAEEFSTPIDIQIIAENNEKLNVEAPVFKEAILKDDDIENKSIADPEAAIPAFNITDFSVPSSTSTLSPTMMEDAARYKTGKFVSGLSEKNGTQKFLIFLLILVLILLTLAQTTYYLRSDIAARWPEARPYLEQACELVQCKIELPKNADLIVVDDSDLQEDADRQGLIHLYSTLVNKANHSQAYPLLELTLTDANDKPLLRRTFKPEEYLPVEASIRRGMFAKEEISIKLSFSVGSEAVSGYRLFVTY